MLKTILLLLPMIFSSQPAMAQQPIKIPDLQSYCVILQIPDDVREPEYAKINCISESSKILNGDDLADKPMPIPYNYNTGMRTPSQEKNGTQMNDNGTYKGNRTNDSTINNNTDKNTDRSTIDNKDLNVTDNKNKSDIGSTNNIKNGLASDSLNQNNNVITIDDDNMYSNYKEAHEALRNKFDGMFNLENEVDELRRELMAKETELMLHKNLYRERLKSLIEKWNKD